MNYWNNLDARERLLLLVAGALIVVLAIFFLGVRPVLSAKTKAETAQSTALRDLEILQTNLPKLSGASAVAGTQPLDRNSVIQSVQINNLELSRIQPENNGALKLWFDEATTPQLYKFISDVTGTYAATVSSVQITRKNNGKVGATLTFTPAGA